LLNDFFKQEINVNPNPYLGDEDLVYDYPNIENIAAKPEQLRVIKGNSNL
jgi:hypothetical protein